MNNRIYLLLLIGVVLSCLGCAPKIIEPVEEKPQQEVIVEEVYEELSPCLKFQDTPRGDEALEYHVIYRDFIKVGELDKAMEYWRYAYNLAPAADGKRYSHYSDGIYFYSTLLSKESDPAQRELYIDSIFLMYDQIMECYPRQEAYVLGRKAFEYYYNFKDRQAKTETFSLFKQCVDKSKDGIPYFVVNPFSAMLVDAYIDKEMSLIETQKYVKLINASIAKGLESGKNVEQWALVKSYAPVKLEQLEGEKGFYDCNYFIEKYYQEFLDNPMDCDVISTTLGRLKWADCPETHPKYLEALKAKEIHCKVIMVQGNLSLAKDELENGNYSKAIDYYREYIETIDDVEKKAKYTLRIAKIYYVHLKRFSTARKYALEAAELKKNWGEPYMIIGRMYASSGPLCGPGRGWDSQMVVWPAIDMWNYAKSIDPSVSAEANKMIGQYAQYMPSKEDIFLRGLKEGNSITVGCWIQKATKIRAAEN